MQPDASRTVVALLRQVAADPNLNGQAAAICRDDARHLIALIDYAGDVDALRALFHAQQTRMAEATARWRAADPQARELILPDLGELLTWLMTDADQARAAAVPTPPPCRRRRRAGNDSGVSGPSTPTNRKASTG
jgi:hypothetical protein